jgi:hypothetical protein
VETPAIPSIAPVTTRRGDNTAARGSAAVFVGLGAAAAAALLWLGAREAPDARPDAAAPSMSATAAPAPSMSATAAPAPAAQVPVVAADQPSGPPLCEPAGEVDPAPRAVEVDRAGPPATRLRPERRRAARVQAMPAQPDEPSAAVPEQPRVEDLIGTRH